MLAKQHKNRVMTEHETHSAQVQAEKPTVLICDDSALNREILSTMLGGEFHLLEAKDGEACIRVLQSEGARISLCLLDIVMPNKDGFDVLAYMNETHLIEEIPVIIITGDDSAVSIRRAYNLGITDYINRPFDSKVVRHRALNTIKLYAKQRRLANMLADRMLQKEENAKVIIDIFSHAVEFRNSERGSHVLNISRLTRLLLEQLAGVTDRYALTTEDIDVISTASMLHDIGKIGIDERILNKPGKLTAEETEMMHRHTLIGAKILEDMREYRDLPLLKTAIDICRWHHERWDGSGYPDGLCAGTRFRSPRRLRRLPIATTRWSASGFTRKHIRTKKRFRCFYPVNAVHSTRSFTNACKKLSRGYKGLRGGSVEKTISCNGNEKVFPCVCAEIPPAGAPSGFDSAAMFGFGVRHYMKLPLRSG